MASHPRVGCYQFNCGLAHTLKNQYSSIKSHNGNTIKTHKDTHIGQWQSLPEAVRTEIGCMSIFTISLHIYLYVFDNMFRSYMTIIRLFYMYINPSFSTIPPYTGQCLHLEVDVITLYNIISIITVRTYFQTSLDTLTPQARKQSGYFKDENKVTLQK
jgi:hypothetical protein